MTLPIAEIVEPLGIHSRRSVRDLKDMEFGVDAKNLSAARGDHDPPQSAHPVVVADEKLTFAVH